MLGLTGYYCTFFTAYADLVQPILQLTHKTVPLIWTDQCQKAFDNLKATLIKNPT